MADMMLDDVAIFESLVDDYVLGDMGVSDAYEHGILSTEGELPHVQDAYDRINLLEFPLDGDIVNETWVLSEANVHTSKIVGNHNVAQPQREYLNDEAIANLHKEVPTCNVCGTAMTPRNGRYGKFYFCHKQCVGQSCVSDKYWQSVCIKSKPKGV